jgi:uncharacterized membrane protein YgcG
MTDQMRTQVDSHHHLDEPHAIMSMQNKTTATTMTRKASIMIKGWTTIIIVVVMVSTFVIVPVNAFSIQQPRVSKIDSTRVAAVPTTVPQKLFEKHRQARESSSSSNNKNDSDGNGVVDVGGSLILTYLEINGWLLTTTTTSTTASKRTSENDHEDEAITHRQGTATLTILIDPILEGPLDFGLPGGLYVGTKKTLPSYGLTESSVRPLFPIDCLLLTQGLEDHAHVKTLKKLFSLDPDIPIIAPPSAKNALQNAGFIGAASSTTSRQQVRFINHGEEIVIRPRQGRGGGQGQDGDIGAATIRATEGALVGPPWQKRENGYIISPVTLPVAPPNNNNNNNNHDGKNHNTIISSFPSIYIEPHVEFNEEELVKIGQSKRPRTSSSSSISSSFGGGGSSSSSSVGGGNSIVDVVLSPITGQTLPAFELVHGPADTIRLLQTLRPKYLVPMRNGNVQMSGPVAALVSEVGTDIDFQERLQTATMKSSSSSSSFVGSDIQIVEAPPGEDIVITL